MSLENKVQNNYNIVAGPQLLQEVTDCTIKNGRSPENSRDSSVDLQSQKDSKRNRPRKELFKKILRCYILIGNLFNLLLLLLAALEYPSIRVTRTYLT